VKDTESEQLFYSLQKLGFHPSEIKESFQKIKWQKNLKDNLKQALSLLRN